MTFLLTAIAFSGHVAIGTIAINRLHSTALPYWMIKIADGIWVLWHVLIPLVWLVWIVDPNRLAEIWSIFGPLVNSHLVVCSLAAISLVPGWIHRRVTRQISTYQLSNDTQIIQVDEELGHLPIHSKIARLLSYFPFNELMELHVNEKRLFLPQLDRRLDGLTITHLSDIHYTGHISEDFHHEVVRRTNSLKSDMIAVTGDLIDKRRCMGWLSDILGQLRAEQGVYFILGNHDLRVRDEFGIRNALTSQGLIDVGRRWMERRIRDCPVVVAGNELPWFVPAADMRDCPQRSGDRALRILLSHSPDQLDWARAHHFDLMLAGHTHGGQIQLPLLGPVFSPSRFGVRYASGTFFENPTLMHVSRGVSGTRHIRVNAPPELTKLVLVCGGDQHTEARA